MKPNHNATERAGYHRGDGTSILIEYYSQAVLDHYNSKCEPGWYWMPQHPGCLPDGEAAGPFETSTLAYKDFTED